MNRSAAGTFWRIRIVLAAGLAVSCAPSAGPAKLAAAAPVAAKPARPPSTPSSRGRVTAMSLTTLLELQQQEKALVFDVRPAFVNTFGHLPGAISWPRHAFGQELPAHEAEIRAALAAGKHLVLYCTDAECPDARAVAEQLADKGYAVAVLEGGFDAWKEAGMPVE